MQSLTVLETAVLAFAAEFGVIADDHIPILAKRYNCTYNKADKRRLHFLLSEVAAKDSTESLLANRINLRHLRIVTEGGYDVLAQKPLSRLLSRKSVQPLNSLRFSCDTRLAAADLALALLRSKTTSDITVATNEAAACFPFTIAATADKNRILFIDAASFGFRPPHSANLVVTVSSDAVATYRQSAHKSYIEPDAALTLKDIALNVADNRYVNSLLEQLTTNQPKAA